MGFKRVTDEATLTEMWTRGDTTPEIAVHFRVTKGAISAAARRYGLPKRKPGRISNAVLAERRAA